MGAKPQSAADYLELLAQHTDVAKVLYTEFQNTRVGDTSRIRRATEGSCRSASIEFVPDNGYWAGYYRVDRAKREISGHRPASIPEFFILCLYVAMLSAASIDITKALSFASQTMAFNGFSPAEVDYAKSTLERLVPFA